MACAQKEQHDDIEKLFDKLCIECHNSETKEASIDLSIYSDKTSFVKNRRVWRRVIEMLESRSMPPKDSRQPTETERKSMLTELESSLEDVDWAAVRSPGRVPMRRVTRDEFQFAAEDLFGVQIDADRILPADPEGLSGFSNDHSSLVMTSKQMTRYFKAAEIVAAAAVDQANQKPLVIHYEVEEGTNASWKKPIAKDSDGSRGWVFSSRLGNKYQSVSKTFDFERTGRYRIKMRARCKGPGENAAAWIAVDSVNDASREAGILVEGNKFAIYETELFVSRGRHTILFGYDFYGPLWLPESPDRAQLKLGQSTFDPPPYDRKGLIPNGVDIADLNANGFQVAKNDLEQAKKLIKKINDGYFNAVLDNLMLHKFHYEKGYLPVFLAGLGYDYQENVVPAFDELAKITGAERSALEKLWETRQPTAYDELRRIADMQRRAWTRQDKSRRQEVGDLFVDWIKLEARTNGPTVPRDSKSIEPYLKAILPRAMQRSDVKRELATFLSVYQSQRSDGANHRAALERMLVAILVSPQFLYRTDGPVAATGVSQIESHALSSRLSSFLWNSVPDDELVRAASRNELANDDEFNQQVDRMLNHKRRKRFARSFTEQWLNLSDIGRGREPDKELFRYFSWRLAEDMRQEVALVFDRILSEDRSILELIDSEESMINERLARLYGIENVTGARFRPVKLNDPRRGGLLGTAAVLTTTSLATRTSPVRRGQFVLETLLDVDLPGPPAGVPELQNDAGQSRTESLRQSLARHRADSKCAGCHNKIDPLGFALENYDWLGRWRENDPAGKVDSNASLPEGQKLNGVKDLKKYLATKRKDQFTTALTKALFKYALGRELEYYDEDAIRKIVAEVKANKYRSRTLIKAIARSYPFRYREIKESKIGE